MPTNTIKILNGPGKYDFAAAFFSVSSDVIFEIPKTPNNITRDGQISVNLLFLKRNGGTNFKWTFEGYSRQGLVGGIYSTRSKSGHIRLIG